MLQFKLRTLLKRLGKVCDYCTSLLVSRFNRLMNFGAFEMSWLMFQSNFRSLTLSFPLKSKNP